MPWLVATLLARFLASVKKAWKLLSKCQEIHRDLCKLGESVPVPDPVGKIAETFVCSMYAPSKSHTSVDEARYFLFCQKSLKSEDLPPTSESLSHHIDRANFQAFVWSRALVPDQNVPSPDGNGWKIVGSRLLPVLMTKSPAPTSIVALTTCQCRSSECKRNCSSRVKGLPCTEACYCMAGDRCSNPANDQSSYDSSDSETEWIIVIVIMSGQGLLTLLRVTL